MSQLTQREQPLYELLQDDLSRQIFIARKQYAETNECDDLWRLIDHPAGFDETINKLKSANYILYGAGAVCKKLVSYLRAMGVIDNCLGIWDKNPDKANTVVNGVSVTLPNPTLDFEYALPAVSEKFKPELFEEILEYFKSIGITEERIIKPFFTILDHPDAYFDDDIIKSRLGNNEVFIDGGCYDFWTSRRFIEICGSRNIRAIHAFEPDNKLFQVCKRNSSRFPFAKCYQAGLWSDNTELHFRVSTPSGSLVVDNDSEMRLNVVALDKCLPKDETITFIKFDIEGSELEGLKGAAERIKCDKPKLAICIYHKPFDYIELLEHIHSLVPEYKMYIRIYAGGGGDTVLYCVI